MHVQGMRTCMGWGGEGTRECAQPGIDACFVLEGVGTRCGMFVCAVRGASWPELLHTHLFVSVGVHGRLICVRL